MRAYRRLVVFTLFLWGVTDCQCGASNVREAEPAISIPTTLSFGPQLQGTQATQNLSVSNIGAAPLQISSATIGTGSNVFSVVSAPSQIAASDSAPIVVGYTPVGLGPDTGTLVVASDDPKAATVTVALNGGPNAPQATLSPSPSLSFVPATTSPETKNALVKSTGLSTLHVQNVLIVTGTNPDFSVGSVVLPSAIPPGSQLTVPINYTRTQQHTANGKLEVDSDDPAGPKFIDLIPDPILPCTTNANCSNGQVCLGGICSPCTADSQCSNNLVCTNGACSPCTGVCSPGQTQTLPCGNCGTGSQTETCGTNCQWGPPGTCSGGGACAPPATQTCNNYGTQTCSTTCAWGACSCPSPPVCAPNALQACGACGTQTCDACGQWGTCTGQNGCLPNSSQVCNTWGTQTCNAACAWGGCSCPSPAVCTPNTTQGCTSCGTETCSACGQWGSCNIPPGGCGDGGVPPDAGTDAGCNTDGTYKVDGGVSYACCIFVNINIDHFVFTTVGSALQVAPGPSWSPISEGAPAYMSGAKLGCPPNTFDVMETITGSCTESYELKGTFSGPTSWNGTLTMTYVDDGSGSCGCFGGSLGTPCANQSFGVHSNQ